MPNPTADDIIDLVTHAVAARSSFFSADDLIDFTGALLGPDVPPNKTGAGLLDVKRAAVLSDINDFIDKFHRPTIPGPLAADLTVKALEKMVGGQFSPKVKIP